MVVNKVKPHITHTIFKLLHSSVPAHKVNSILDMHQSFARTVREFKLAQTEIKIGLVF